MRRLVPTKYYLYEDPAGSPLFEKVRFEVDGGRGKDFRFRWSDGLTYHWELPANSDRWLFQLPQLLKAKERRTDIYWCEGEKDALALKAIGLVGTTHHQGAARPHPSQAEWFRGHRGRVILAVDRDEVGALDGLRRYRLLRSVGLRERQLFIVRSAVHKRGADIADHLAAGFSIEQLVPVSLKTLAEQAAKCTQRRSRRAGYRWSG